jgi:hypothetical protein
VIIKALGVVPIAMFGMVVSLFVGFWLLSISTPTVAICVSLVVGRLMARIEPEILKILSTGS